MEKSDGIQQNTIQTIGNSSFEKQKNSRRFMGAGIVIMVFAVIGLAAVIAGIVYGISVLGKSDGDFSDYNAYLIPVAAVDMSTFDDIGNAEADQLINAALWSLIRDADAPDKYTYDNGYMMIPQTDVEQRVRSYFGDEVTVSHQTVQGYGCEFTYDITNKQYKIPLTGLTPIYTPKVIEAQEKNSSVILTVGMVNAEIRQQDDEGNIISPAPDKYLKITMLEQNDGYYISAIQSVSAVPETVEAVSQ